MHRNRGILHLHHNNLHLNRLSNRKLLQSNLTYTKSKVFVVKVRVKL